MAETPTGLREPLETVGSLADASGMTIGRAALLGFAGSTATTLLSIARTKVVAIVLGPTGVGMIAEILQLVTLANAPVAIISGAPLISAVAAARARGDTPAITRIYQTTLTTVLVISFVAALLATVLGLWLLPSPWGRSAWPLTLTAGAGTLVMGFSGVILQLLTAVGQLKRVMYATVVIASVSSVATAICTLGFKLPGHFASLVLGPVLVLPLVIILAMRGLPEINLKPDGTFDRKQAWMALRIGGSSLVANVTSQMVFIAIRETLQRKGGPALIGQYQAAWSIASMYFTFIVASLGTYAFPRYAAAPDSTALDKEIRDTTRFLFRTVPPFILIVLAFRTFAVRLLYSHAFDESISLLGLIVAGDAAKAISWAQAGPLLYRGRLRAYIVTELLGATLVISGVIVAVPHFGLLGIGYTYVVVYLTYAFVTGYITHRACSVGLDWRRLVLTSLLTGGLFVSAIVTQHYPIAGVALVLGSAVWAYRSGLLASIWSRVRARLSPPRQTNARG